ncbi:hypothetical protein K493DRAFT_255273 [Basidiobolus meristosporus CBS 931.73]|uniref:Thiamine-binding protein domain-containing protein n=1 Tax=Basidiobolus meristosporus CBS 931.73 TaxID=1314790 RepID=A0A1Y1YVU3_9FUNG|nr:hypothetical protein K493DRAFT_255273 [Basidiobolus meristosporus CBS 931.73]|eukprot:ORY01954.1 hypothetical protein K493DRAFT_255273 [Basidiobolus meristosporus CBS 931.73]
MSLYVVADFCVIPMGVESSVSKYVAACQTALEQTGLTYVMHGYGTNIEGDWDAVSNAIKKCHEAVHALGCPRVSTSVRIGTRLDKESHIQDKIDSVHKLLAESKSQ